jgi:hypothetical protein
MGIGKYRGWDMKGRKEYGKFERKTNEREDGIEAMIGRTLKEGVRSPIRQSQE